MYTIENNSLLVGINGIGAELSRIVDKRTGESLLWEGDPAVWKGRSPWLFPIVGQLKGGFFRYQGRRFDLPMHGFARRMRFEAEQPDRSRACFTLRDTPDTLASYPWRFALSIDYALRGRRLDVACTVKNADDETMYYSLGAHPGLVCREGDSLAFEGMESCLYRRLDAASHLLRPERRPLPLENGALTLRASLFERDAMILENPRSTCVTLRRADGLSVRVTHDAVPWLGVWSKPTAGGLRYVCIEPWLGVDDPVDSDQAVEHKEAVQTLPPGEERTFALAIEPEE